MSSNVSPLRPKTRPEPLFLFEARRPVEAANPDMIAQVITHADQAARLAGGRLRLRISPRMIEQLQRQGRLGADAHRLADLSVTWDEAEGQVVQVRDDARLRDAAVRFAEWDALWDEESYAQPRSAAA